MLETANRLRESGKEAEAEAMLRQQPPSTRIDLTLADWAQQRRDYTAARAAYQNVLTREPANADAILGLTEVDIAAGDKAAARSQLAKLPATDNASLNTQRRVALAQAQLGDTAAAQRTFISQDLWQAGQRSQADTLMRNLAQQKSNDPEQVYAYGLYLRLRAVPLWS